LCWGVDTVAAICVRSDLSTSANLHVDSVGIGLISLKTFLLEVIHKCVKLGIIFIAFFFTIVVRDLSLISTF
jgi:hypothetical protein